MVSERPAATGAERHHAWQTRAGGVFSLDLLGFGASDQPTIPLDNRVWGRQVNAFVERVVQRPAVLLGNSLGALTALTAAVLEPELIRAVVAAPLPDPALIQPIPPRRPPLATPLATASTGIGVAAASPGAVGASDRPHRSAQIWPPGRLPPIDRFRPGAAAADCPTGAPSTAARALRAMSLGMALRPRGATAPALLQQLKRPLLLIWGQQDRFVPLSVTRKIHAYRPNTDLVVIDACGHCPHDERPDQIVAVMLPWLDRNLGG